MFRFNAIKEVMLFPQMRPVVNESKEEDESEGDGVIVVVVGMQLDADCGF